MSASGADLASRIDHYLSRNPLYRRPFPVERARPPRGPESYQPDAIVVILAIADKEAAWIGRTLRLVAERQNGRHIPVAIGLNSGGAPNPSAIADTRSAIRSAQSATGLDIFSLDMGRYNRAPIGLLRAELFGRGIMSSVLPNLDLRQCADLPAVMLDADTIDLSAGFFDRLLSFHRVTDGKHLLHTNVSYDNPTTLPNLNRAVQLQAALVQGVAPFLTEASVLVPLALYCDGDGFSVDDRMAEVPRMVRREGWPVTEVPETLTTSSRRIVAGLLEEAANARRGVVTDGLWDSETFGSDEAFRDAAPPQVDLSDDDLDYLAAKIVGREIERVIFALKDRGHYEKVMGLSDRQRDRLRVRAARTGRARIHELGFPELGREFETDVLDAAPARQRLALANAAHAGAGLGPSERRMERVTGIEPA